MIDSSVLVAVVVAVLLFLVLVLGASFLLLPFL